MKMSDFLDSSIGKIFRWVLFIPISLAVSGIANWVIYSLRFDSWSEYMIAYIPTHCISNGGSFYAAVIAVYLVVPHFKMRVAIIFASLFALFNLAYILIPFVYGETPYIEHTSFLPSNGDIGQISIIGIISGIIGSIIGIVHCEDM